MLSSEAAQVNGPVIIVGGGLGALLLAERLARHHVLVVVADKNADFGGCNGRSASGVPLVCYKALGFEPGSALARLVTDPALWSRAAPRRMAAIDHVFFPGEAMVLPGTLDAFRAALAERHPAEWAAIGTLCDAMQRVYGAIRVSGGLAAPAARLEATTVLREFAPQRWADWLRRHVADEGLRRLLSVRAFSHGNSALTMLAYLGKMLIDGLYALPESGASLCDALVERLRASPYCRLMPGAWVDEILFDVEAQACGVRLRSGERLYGSVVLNVDPGRVAERMAGGTIGAELGRVIAGHGVSLSALNLVYSLTPDLGRTLAVHRDTARFFHSEAVDPFDVLAAREVGRFDLRNCKINLDFGDDGTALRAYAEFDCSPRALAAGSDLVALARSVLHRRLTSLQPDFADGVAAIEIITPHHFAARSDHRDGASSGFAEAEAAAGPRPLDRWLAEHGLHQVGQWSAHGSGLSQLDASAAAVYSALRRAHPASAPAR